MNRGVLLRVYTMIAGVSAVSLFVFGQQFSEAGFAIAAVAVATVALVSVILGALLAMRTSLEAGAPSAEDGESTRAG